MLKWQVGRRVGAGRVGARVWRPTTSRFNAHARLLPLRPGSNGQRGFKRNTRQSSTRIRPRQLFAPVKPAAMPCAVSASPWWGKWRWPEFMSKKSTEAGDGFNRWLVPPAAMAVHLCIGSVYAWSIFNGPLTRELGVVAPSAADWSLTSVVPVFSTSIVFLGLSAALGGRYRRLCLAVLACPHRRRTVCHCNQSVGSREWVLASSEQSRRSAGEVASSWALWDWCHTNCRCSTSVTEFWVAADSVWAMVMLCTVPSSSTVR